MSYQKQNFSNGEVLTASQLNHIENGIADVESTANATKGVVNKIIDPTLSLSGKAADARATGDVVGEIKEDLIVNYKNGTETLGLYSAFENGGLLNGADARSDYRVRSKSIITADRNWKFVIPTGWRIGLHYFVDSVYTESSGWIDAGTFDVAIGTSFRIVIRKKAEDTSVVANVNEFVSAIAFDTYIQTKINEHGTKINTLDATVNNMLEYGTQIFETSDFSQGSLTDGNLDTNNKFRVSSNKMLTFSRDITVVAKSGFRFSVQYFVNGEYTAPDSGWQTNYTIAKNSVFKISISKRPEDTSIIADVDEFVSAISIESYFTPIDNYIGQGNTTYYGDRIEIGDVQTTHKCNISTWKKYLSSEIQGIDAYNFPRVQSMAMVNGKVFLFASTGICTIIDYDTKEIESYCTFTPNTRQHANSAQFTDIYYDSNDDFPLLLLSRCGNSVTVVQPSDDAALVYRITVNNGVYTMTLINSIFTTFDTYGSSWGVDNNSKKLYLETYLAGTYQTTSNNPIRYLMFDMPNETAIKSGNSISLSEVNIRAQMLYEHQTFQGVTVNGGVIYTGMTYSGQHVWAVDIMKNRVTSKVKLTASQEVEGVAIHNEKIYVCQRNGNGTDDEKLAIYELTF